MKQRPLNKVIVGFPDTDCLSMGEQSAFFGALFQRITELYREKKTNLSCDGQSLNESPPFCKGKCTPNVALAKTNETTTNPQDD